MNPLLSIIIPCFNEDKNIPLMLDRFNAAIQSRTIEVIMVNNGSTDQSKEIFAALIPQYPFVSLVNIEKNQGYGYGIYQGLKAAHGIFLGWTHADLQTDPKDVIKAYDLLVENNLAESIYVKGRRRGRSVFDSIFTWGMSIFETIYLKTWLIDINAQPNVFHRNFFASLNNFPYDFSFDLYMLYTAKKHGLEIIRFDVQFPERIHGHSSWNDGLTAKWKFIKRTLDFSIQLKQQKNLHSI